MTAIDIPLPVDDLEVLRQRRMAAALDQPPARAFNEGPRM
jgi:hypothetical protein